MGLKNMTIGTQLRTGLGLILFLVLLLGGVAWYQTGRLWEQTEGLYNHPYQVRKAISELQKNILKIHGSLKNIVISNDMQSIQSQAAAIAVLEATAFRQIEFISRSYLGPPADVEHIYNAMAKYKPIRENIMDLMKAGSTREAVRLSAAEGPAEMQLGRILKEINDVSDFALDRADRFYENAEIEKANMQKALLIFLTGILLISFAISLILIKQMRSPLEEMITATDDYRKGNLDSRIEYSSKNEFGKLASSFNSLVEANTLEMQNRDVVGQISDVMLKQTELHPFCHELLRILMEKSGSQIGAVYLLNEEQTAFEHFESIGFSEEARSSFSATAFEGEFGLTLANRQIQFVKDIPKDTLMLYNTTAGALKPREIVSIPILSGEEIVAIVSLSSLNTYRFETVRFINDIYNTLTARFIGILAHQKILDFSKKLEEKNRELDERARELTIQGEELTEQNSELEMQKSQLDEASRLKSSFLSNMSHELRTPLNSVIALSGVLSRRLENIIPEEEYSYIGIIDRNGRNLLTLINDILDLSRIESGHEDVTVSSFSLYDLVDEVVTMLEHQARDKRIELVNKVTRGLQPIQSDYIKCRHILQNIIGNAVKFTDQGKVEVSSVVLQNEMGIAVSDTGIGISDHDLPKIFDEFRQADEGSSRKYGGTGLGLAIARKYAGLLKGKIMVVSRPGRGSTFTLILPLKPDFTQIVTDNEGSRLTHHAHRSTVSQSANSGAGKNILLVEDSEPAIIQVKDILCEKGYTVFAARNGKEAMDELRRMVPDAMILDLMMPEVDGFQVLKMIREKEATSKLPVLILTAKHITKEELSFLKGNNVHQFIRKGDVSKSELLAVIDEMVNQHPPEPAVLKSRIRPALRTGNPLILVVEDNPDDIKTIKALLDSGVTIVEAHDGAEGVSQALMHKPDLILMDISLPVMDGFSAFGEIRKTEALKDIPVIAITAKAMKGNREEILECGFDDYISKPIDEPLFRRVLRHYLQGDDEAGYDTV